VRVHLVGEHALELEAPDICLERLRLGLDVLRSRFIILAFGQLQQLTGIGNAFGGLVDFLDGGREPRPLLA
jgi:hypothetical protein